jgi:parvulin-like peptidyl-prolyl isomerase
MFSFAMIIPHMLRIVCLPTFFFLIVACERRPTPPPAESALAIARIGDKIVTDKDLSKALDSIRKKFPREFSAHPEKKSLLEQLINMELLFEAAMSVGLQDEPEYKTRLADLYVEKLSEKARSSIKETDLIVFYDENKKAIDQVSARHILMKSQDREKLEQIRKDLIKDPSRFPELAKQYSTDGSASRGGELGAFSFGMMVEPFSRAAFALKKPSEISPVIETQFGIHVIQLMEDRRGFELNRSAIEAFYLKKKQAETLKKEIERLRANRKIEIYEDALQKMSPLPEIINQDPSETLKINVPSIPQ